MRCVVAFSRARFASALGGMLGVVLELLKDNNFQPKTEAFSFGWLHWEGVFGRGLRKCGISRQAEIVIRIRVVLENLCERLFQCVIKTQEILE